MKLETQTEQLIVNSYRLRIITADRCFALAQTANALAAQGTVFSVCPDITEDETDTDIKNEDMQDTHRNICKRQCTDCLSRNMCSKSRIHRSKTTEKSM